MRNSGRAANELRPVTLDIDANKHAEEIKLERVLKLSYSKRLLQASARLLSPLL